LGNLALALKLEPQLPKLIRQVVLMGGAVLEPGNVSPVAEANIWNDPHAADIVFNAGWPVTMVGLDVTHQVIVPLKMIQAVAAHQRHPATDVLLQAVGFYANFYSNLYPRVAAIHGCFGHDVLAFIALTNPGLFTRQSGRMRVATEGVGQGQTMLDRRGITWGQAGWGPERPEVQVCMQVDAAAALADFESHLMSDFLKK
jgi:inosine-uridine nucleoside N-ribohydrolase